MPWVRISEPPTKTGRVSGELQSTVRCRPPVFVGSSCISFESCCFGDFKLLTASASYIQGLKNISIGCRIYHNCGPNTAIFKLETVKPQVHVGLRGKRSRRPRDHQAAKDDPSAEHTYGVKGAERPSSRMEGPGFLSLHRDRDSGAETTNPPKQKRIWAPLTCHADVLSADPGSSFPVLPKARVT